MKRKRWMKILCFLALAGVFAGGAAWAGGVMLYQFGSPDVGYAAAGYAARAQDAATVFTNPAGMGRLEKSQVLGGLQALYGDVGFSPNASTTVAGDDGGCHWLDAQRERLHRPEAQPGLEIGFGVLSYFGLSENYGDTWVGRYLVQEIDAPGANTHTGRELPGEQLALSGRRAQHDVRHTRRAGGR